VDNVLLGLALGGAFSDVGMGLFVSAPTADGDHVEGPVGVAVQTMTDGLTRRDLDRGGAAQVRKGRLIFQALWVISCSYQ
jgi:hypothetical protein